VAGSVAVGMPLPGVLGGLWDAFRGLTDGDVTKENSRMWVVGFSCSSAYSRSLVPMTSISADRASS
jgi:hypothetical protein